MLKVIVAVLRGCSVELNRHHSLCPWSYQTYPHLYLCLDILGIQFGWRGLQCCSTPVAECGNPVVQDLEFYLVTDMHMCGYIVNTTGGVHDV
jgi:hypothetical protein